MDPSHCLNVVMSRRLQGRRGFFTLNYRPRRLHYGVLAKILGATRVLSQYNILKLTGAFVNYYAMLTYNLHIYILHYATLT